MSSAQGNHTAAAGTVGGTLLSILANLQQEDLVKTIILAALGAVVSFSVSVILKYLKYKFFR